MTTTSRPPDTARVFTAAVTGAEGHPTQIHATISEGPPGLRISGLPEPAAAPTCDRVRAAVINSGLTWPEAAVDVSLRPRMPKRGSSFDLAIAVAILAATGVVPAGSLDGCVLVAGLGLDGKLCPASGILPALLAAVRAGHTTAVVAAADAGEASLVPGITVRAFGALADVASWLRGDPWVQPLPPSEGPGVAGGGGSSFPLIVPGLNLPPQVRLAVEAAAAGGHHLCLAGPGSVPLSALAAGLVAVMPDLTPGEAVEVAAVRSVAGLPAAGALPSRPPLRTPHHSITVAGMAGGGAGVIRPGEAALAHRGVLVLGDAAEFARAVLGVLRQPLSEGQISVSRSGTVVRFPARFTLAASLRACPCGGWPRCACTPVVARRYRARFTSVLGSHISIWLPATSPCATSGEELSAGRVAQARERARRRLADTPWQRNTDVPGPQLRAHWMPTAEAFTAVSRAVELGEISARAAHQVIRLAWTLADIDGTGRPGAAECGQALAYQMGVAR
jgi:magnesium chelatase family protein